MYDQIWIVEWCLARNFGFRRIDLERICMTSVLGSTNPFLIVDFFSFFFVQRIQEYSGTRRNL